MAFYLFYFVWSFCLLSESTIFLILGRKRIREWAQVDWERKCNEASGDTAEVLRNLVHLIVLPNYKEPVSVLSDTMEFLASHTYAKEKYIICLAMEQAESDSLSKANQLTARFSQSFKRILVTTHPVGLPGESRGKAPNVSWAVESSLKLLSEYRMEDILVTVCDADTHFLNDYFLCLSYTFASGVDRQNMMFAAPISFYSNALEVPSLVRVADMIWSITVTQQMSTGRRVRFPCSAYSIAMKLAHRVGFWDTGPEAIGEDVHMFLKCLFKTRGEARIETIYIPVGCFNICGDSWLKSVRARYDQMVRHLWGTFDLVYVIQQSILVKDMSYSLKLWAFYEMIKVRLVPATLTYSVMILPTVLRLVFPVYSTEPYISIFGALMFIQVIFLFPGIGTSVAYELMHKDIVTQAVAKGAAQPSQRRQWKHIIIDWILFPLVSVGFFFVCSIHVHIRQFFTDNINYQVAQKPTTPKHLQEVLVNSS